jgi:hypothetical protein
METERIIGESRVGVKVRGKGEISGKEVRE